MSAARNGARRPFTVSVVKNTQMGGKLCKAFRYDEVARDVLCEPAAFLSEGQATLAEFDSIGAFMAFRSKLENHSALMMGAPCYSPAQIVTQKVLAGMSPAQRGKDHVIARDRSHVSWPEGPSLVMLDLDRPDRFPAEIRAKTPTSPDGWRQLLIDLLPGLEGVQMGWAPSSSSCLYVDGRELHGVRGQRLYLVINSGQAIPQFKEALRDALVRRALVWYEVSKSGALLPRFPFDLAVYQPEHLDFAANPECAPPLDWRPVPFSVWHDVVGSFLTTANLPVTSEADRRRTNAALADLRRAKLDEARAVRRKWREETGRRIALHLNLDPARAEEVAEAASDRGVLLAEFLLTDSDGATVSVGELLRDAAKHHGRRFHDPLEPEYRNDPRIAVFLVGDAGEARIHSHAHGGQTWRCQLSIPVVHITQIDRTVDRISRVLEEDSCGLYRNGDALVWVSEADARMQPLGFEGLGLRIQRRCSVMKGNAKGLWVPGDLTPRILKALESEAPLLPIPQLDSVVRGPFARSDGSIVDRPGYDPASRVVYVSSSPHPPMVRRGLGVHEAEEALRFLWHAVHLFPLKTDVDRGVLLAAMLSGAARSSIPIAPGYYFTAHTAGTGKTLLAQTVVALGTGAAVAASPLPRDEEERRKHIFAALRQGESYLVYDNTERGSELDSAVLANLITSPLINERVLGVSIVEQRPNRLTVVLTGNNLTLRGDLNRRILPVTLDAGVEHPWQREFPFHPVNHILANWLRSRIASLELLEAWQTDGAPLVSGSTGFPDWDRIVRSVVAWVGRRLDIGVGFADPAEAIRVAYADDPESDALEGLLAAWAEVFGDREVLLKDVEDLISSSQALDFVSGDSQAPVPESRKRATSLAEAREAALGRPETWRGDPRARFGMYLARHEGRIVRGLKLVRTGLSGGARRWRVVRVKPGLVPAAEPVQSVGAV